MTTAAAITANTNFILEMIVQILFHSVFAKAALKRMIIGNLIHTNGFPLAL